MKYNIAICDDNSADITFISSIVSEWAKMQGNIISIKTFSSAESFLFSYVDCKDYDILLLDIEMGGINGVQLAKEIRKSNEAVQIVFITGYSDYVTDGYDVSALHYLVKPVDKEKLFEVLSRAALKVMKNERNLMLDLSNETVRIPFHEISFLEVRQNYVTIHAKQDYTVKKTLGEFEVELDERFYRTGRSFIINLTYIQRITKTEVYLSNGSIIPLPRGQYETLNRAIIKYI